MSLPSLRGLHHVTAICGDPRTNHRFYAGTLGLRLVKRTVNFDDPDTYHLYYGDGAGSPGTVLTFFPWVGVPRGRPGPGRAAAAAFRVAAASLPWWKRRLEGAWVAVTGPFSRLGETCLAFGDPDGLALEIVGTDGPSLGAPFWPAAPVPAPHALEGFHSVTLAESAPAGTELLLVSEMGFEATALRVGPARRYRAPGGGPASFLDVVTEAGSGSGRMGSGTIHHVAFRVPDDAGQKAWRAELLRRGRHVSPVMDRSYFHSIYFREPGGVLFEIATDAPGFALDEAGREPRGERLMLPPQYEADRAKIMRRFPPACHPLSLNRDRRRSADGCPGGCRTTP